MRYPLNPDTSGSSLEHLRAVPAVLTWQLKSPELIFMR